MILYGSAEFTNSLITGISGNAEVFRMFESVLKLATGVANFRDHPLRNDRSLTP